MFPFTAFLYQKEKPVLLNLELMFSFFCLCIWVVAGSDCFARKAKCCHLQWFYGEVWSFLPFEIWAINHFRVTGGSTLFSMTQSILEILLPADLSCLYPESYLPVYQVPARSRSLLPSGRTEVWSLKKYEQRNTHRGHNMELNHSDFQPAD